jgi:hypothetical protein
MLAGAVTGTARPAGSHAGNNDPAAIHACVDIKKRTVRIVGVAGSCDFGEAALHWAITGPSGAQGPPGPQGVPGPGLAAFEDLAGLACGREGFPGIIELSYDPADGAAVLRCAVNAAPATLSADPTQLHLVVGQGAQMVTVANDGQLSSGVLTVSLANQGGGTFQIVGDGCTGQVLAGSGTCTVGVQITFAGPQGAFATLNITATPGGTAAVSLQGNFPL